MVVKGLKQEGQPVGSSLFPPGNWLGAVLSSGLPICERKCLGSLFFTCLNCGLWRSLNSTRPLHSFGSLSCVLAKVKKFLSLIVTVDPSSYILYVTLSPVICAGNILESPTQRSSVSFLCLDMPNQFQLWLIRFARVIRNHEHSVIPCAAISAPIC